MSTIQGIQEPTIGDTGYQVKIENSLNAIDVHDHSLDKGDPVKRIDTTAVDNSTVELNGSNKLSLKSGGLTAAKFSGGIAPIGTVIAYTGTSAPSGWLLCQGAQVSQATYSGLFALIGESWGAKVGTSTFALPDLRGLFLRGRANTSANDPDRSTRTALVAGGATGDNVGSYQADEMIGHTHSGALTTGIRGRYNDGKVGVGGHAYGPVGSMNTNSTVGLTAGTYKEGTSNTNESRPVNIAVNYLIKY